MKSYIGCIIVMATICEQAGSQIQVTFSGDTTKIWDRSTEWPCGARFILSTNIDQNSIFIAERDTMPLANCTCYYTLCTCYYTLCTSIVGLNSGAYHALISRQYKFPLQLTYTTVSTDSITFTVPNASSSALAISLYQSACSHAPVSVSDREGSRASPVMISNYPNPFNPGTIIRYSVPRTAHVTLSIFDMTGRQLSMLVDRTESPGIHEVSYDAIDLPSGTYICRLIVADQVLSTKMLVVK